MNLFFVVVEIFGGFFTNSFAILSDAVHDLGDCVAIGLAYVMEKLSKKAPDEKYTYGYRRYSLLSAIATSGLLVVSSAFVIYGAVMRLGEPQEVKGGAMLLVAVFGVVINGAAVVVTHRGTGANERAISLHMLEDVLGWVAVLIGSALIYAFRWYFVDGILSLCIAVFLIIHSVINIKDVFAILLEKTPKSFNLQAYREQLYSISGVQDVHHLHVWSLDGERVMATLHVRICEGADMTGYTRVKRAVEELSARSGISHLTVQIDVACQ
ncbi:MAG: cation transporter [Clostridia bacterium]|nr:cation transporter [Clostridia bacterium]